MKMGDFAKTELLMQRHTCIVRESNTAHRGMNALNLQHRKKMAVQQRPDATPTEPGGHIDSDLDRESVRTTCSPGRRISIPSNFVIVDRDEPRQRNGLNISQALLDVSRCDRLLFKRHNGIRDVMVIDVGDARRILQPCFSNCHMVNFSGRWRADLQASKLLHPPPQELLIDIDHSGNRITEEIRSIPHDGAEQRLVFSCTTTGEDGHSTFDGKPIRGQAYWQDDELIIESWAELGGGERYFRDCWLLSPDGQTLTMEHRNDALGGQKIVLKKIG